MHICPKVIIVRNASQLSKDSAKPLVSTVLPGKSGDGMGTQALGRRGSSPLGGEIIAEKPASGSLGFSSLKIIDDRQKLREAAESLKQAIFPETSFESVAYVRKCLSRLPELFEIFPKLDSKGDLSQSELKALSMSVQAIRQIFGSADVGGEGDGYLISNDTKESAKAIISEFIDREGAFSKIAQKRLPQSIWFDSSEGKELMFSDMKDAGVSKTATNYVDLVATIVGQARDVAPALGIRVGFYGEGTLK